jgi:hypothetical protein
MVARCVKIVLYSPQQGILVYPKSSKSESFLATRGKSQNTPRESEKWRTCTARIFDSGESVRAEGLSIDPASLYGAFEQVADGREARKENALRCPCC